MATEFALNSTVEIVPFGIRRATIIVPALRPIKNVQGEARILYGDTAHEAVSTFSVRDEDAD